jgi:hypothetical protein
MHDNKKEIEHLKSRQMAWIRDGNEWVEDMFGDNIKLSNQQSEAFRELSKIICAKIMLSAGEPLSEEETRYSEFIGVNIPAGMGVGKDFWASLVTLYGLCVFPDEGGQPPHGLASANTKLQLKNVLWRQIASILPLSKKMRPDDPKSPTIMEEMFVHQAEKVYLRSRGGKRHFVEAVTIPQGSDEEQAKALTGRHAPYMFFILDEASGMPECIFKELEGTLTGIVNLIIMIYNPRRSRGYVADAATSKRWLTLRWSGEEAFFDDPKMDIPIKRQRDDLISYGRDSNPYRIRVMGLPPIMGNDMFFPWDWVQGAVDRELDPLEGDITVMGVDPARGGDNSVIVIRQGQRIVHIEAFNEVDTMRFLDKVVAAYYKWDPVSINIDSIGLGGSFFDRARQLGLPVYEADYRRTSRDKRKYKLVRDELWSELREDFEKGRISIPDDKRLLDQLGSIKIKDYSGKGVITVPSKQQMKKDIGYSPDEADGICLSRAIPDDQLRLMVNRALNNDDYDDEEETPQRDEVTGY